MIFSSAQIETYEHTMDNFTLDYSFGETAYEYLDKITTSVRKLHCYHTSSHFLNTEILPNCRKEYIFE